MYFVADCTPMQKEKKLMTKIAEDGSGTAPVIDKKVICRGLADEKF